MTVFKGNIAYSFDEIEWSAIGLSWSDSQLISAFQDYDEVNSVVSFLFDLETVASMNTMLEEYSADNKETGFSLADIY